MTRINNEELSEETCKNMKELTIRSTYLGRELGMILCKQNNIINPGAQCKGSECSLSIKKRCDSGDYTGFFHTHPKTKQTIAGRIIGKQAQINPQVDPELNIRMSHSDLLNTLYDGFGCIGYTKDNNIMIKCLNKKMIPIKMNIQAVEEFNYIGKELDSLIKKGDKKAIIQRLDYLSRKYFKTTEFDP